MDETDYDFAEARERETEKLFERIRLREEMIGLLKIARPEMIADIREAISRLDKSIESTEKIIQLQEEAFELREKHEADLEKLIPIADRMLEELREHLADDPKKLELLEAMLEDDGKSH